MDLRRFFRHFFFWIVILFFQVTRSTTGVLSAPMQNIWLVLIEHACMLPVLMAASYFTADFIFPHYFYKKKWWHFAFTMTVSATFFILAMQAFLHYIYFPRYYPGIISKYPHFFQFNMFQYTFYIYSTVAIVLMVKYVERSNRLEKQRIDLEKMNYASELALLKSQINPHFLFNTLNNINALIKKNPDKSYISIIKLSDLMRYMIFDVRDEFVSLHSEINYLKSFIDLLSLRHDDPGYIRLKIEGDPDNLTIAPMLLIPFVENAFKHGNKDMSPGILINLEISDRLIFYQVTNFLTPKPLSSDKTSGIGIPNLKRRLELLYPGRHSIDTITEEGRYIASFSIENEKRI